MSDKFAVKNNSTESHPGAVKQKINEFKTEVKKEAAQSKANLNKLAVEVAEVSEKTAHEIGQGLGNLKQDIQQRGAH
mgnify:FL=1